MLSMFTNVAELATSSSSTGPVSETKVESLANEVHAESPVHGESPTPSPTNTDHSSSSAYFSSIPLLLKRDAPEEPDKLEIDADADVDADVDVDADADLQPKPPKRRRKPDCKPQNTLYLKNPL